MAQVVKEYGEIIEQKVDDIHLQQKIINHKLSRIAILTDSIADITDEIMLNYQIHFVPLTLILDDVSYLDKRTIDNKILFELIKGAKAYPTSSQPEPGRVKEKLEYLLENYDSIIAVTVSEKLSGTYATFKREADKLAKNGKKITVINSKLNSGAQGIIVKKAAELIVDGVSHEDIVKQIKDMIPRTKIYVCLETIENAVRGGRVSNRVGKIGIAIGARPIMTIDQNGKGATFAMGFSQKGLTKKIFSIARKINASKGIESYSIVHVENTSLAKIYEDYLFKLTGKKAEFVTTISSVTSIHSGLGSVAISVVEK
jgi:DegV family protein with EDD domain